MTEEHLYTYNDNNQLIKEFHKHEFGYTEQTEHRYNLKGLLIYSHEIQKDKNGIEVKNDLDITYEYDSHNNWIKKITKNTMNNICIIDEREINYYNEPEKSEFIKLIENMKQQKKIAQFCNEEAARNSAAYFMSLNYPDWQICTEIKITSIGNCKFNIQFQVINPHMKQVGVIQKEQIVAEIDLSIENYTKFNLRIIRGTMY